MNSEELNEYHKDIFKEIGNVGIGTGSTALSQMISRSVEIDFPNVSLVDVQTVFSQDGEFLVSSCQLQGDLDGCISAIFDKENGFKLIDLMFFQEKGTLKELNDDAMGAYNEMLNVVGGCYLNSLADMLKIKLMPQPPKFFLGKLEGMKDHLEKGTTESFFVQTCFTIDGEQVVGSIFLILSSSSIKKILEIIDSMNL
jgi:chemotaxis protein CheY-P-specific phosphatase CheC